MDHMRVRQEERWLLGFWLEQLSAAGDGLEDKADCRRTKFTEKIQVSVGHARV